MTHECVSAIVTMREQYFDDLKVGNRFKSEPLNVTEKHLIEFAHKFDPQMFHLSRKRAERTIFKGLNCQWPAHGGHDDAAVCANIELRRRRHRPRGR